MLRAHPGTTDTALPLPHPLLHLPGQPALITTAFPISFLACKLKTKTKSHVVSLSYFFSPLLCLVRPVCLLHVSLSAEPSPAKTDSNLEADERATAG